MDSTTDVFAQKKFSKHYFEIYKFVKFINLHQLIDTVN